LPRNDHHNICCTAFAAISTGGAPLSLHTHAVRKSGKLGHCLLRLKNVATPGDRPHLRRFAVHRAEKLGQTSTERCSPFVKDSLINHAILSLTLYSVLHHHTSRTCQTLSRVGIPGRSAHLLSCSWLSAPGA